MRGTKVIALQRPVTPDFWWPKVGVLGDAEVPEPEPVEGPLVADDGSEFATSDGDTIIYHEK